MKRLGLLLLLLGCLTAQAQFRDMNRSANWIFGNRAGLKFVGYADSIPGNERVELFKTCTQVINKEGVSTMSDAQGNLLFHAGGTWVGDATLSTMKNGNELFGNVSTTQTSVIVPQPGSDSLYYLFSNYKDCLGTVFYSIIDMSLNNGYGAVTAKNIRLNDTLGIDEKIAAVRHSEKDAYWVLTRRCGSDQFYLYYIDETGLVLDSTKTQVIGTVDRRFG